MYALDAGSNGLVPHALSKGTRIADRFVVEAKIADGTVASVYRALDERSNAKVALKVFDPLRSADPVARRRFEREFAILTKLRLPGVARAIDFLPGEDLDVLVLELIEGEPLADRFARGPMDTDEAVRLAVQLAATLEACHEAGVVHRDLKPRNVVLHAERGPVILDFGVAWFSSAMTLTQTGAIVGSPRYLAPETFESSHVDERADLYALGAILFEALTGRAARDADTIVEMANSAAMLDTPSVREHAPHVSVAIDGVVRRALSWAPEQRYATAREMRRALLAGEDRAVVPLDRKLPCKACGTSLIVDLPVCPGCGAATDWALERGAYAVQILEVERKALAARALADRYGTALRMDASLLTKRLATLPAPLAVGVSSNTAEALASAARSAGCRVEVVRTRSVLGPALRVPSFSAGQILYGMGLHFLAVLGLGTVAILFGASDDAVTAVPFGVGAIGAAAALWWSRAPILSVEAFEARAFVHPKLEPIAARLRRLAHPRSRRLAAGAVARIAPLLMADDGGLSVASQEDAFAALDEALDAAETLDTHQAVLATQPRARLRALAARTEVDSEEHRRIERAHREISDLAVAHDLAARRALEATELISEALAARGVAGGDALVSTTAAGSSRDGSRRRGD